MYFAVFSDKMNICRRKFHQITLICAGRISVIIHVTICALSCFTRITNNPIIYIRLHIWNFVIRNKFIRKWVNKLQLFGGNAFFHFEI